MLYLTYDNSGINHKDYKVTMKQSIQRTIIAIVAVMLLTPVAVSAEENSGSTSTGTGDSSTATPKPSTTPSPEMVRKYKEQLNAQLQQMKSERREAVEDADGKKPLNDARKKVCEKHLTQIDALMSNMNKRRQGAFDRITKVYDAVQKYYTNHNLSIANYNDLIAKADAAQSAAQASMTAQVSVPVFKCDGQHPLTDVSDFKEKRADSIDAMKAYRDAVKAVVKAVKAVAPADSTNPSASPAATKEAQ